MFYKKITKNVQYNALELFNIVTDVAQYPQFVPHCDGVTVVSESDVEILAQMFINYKTRFKDFKVSYLSSVKIVKDRFFVSIVNADKGLFKSLQSSWLFLPIAGGCRVEYEIAFSLQNPLLNVVLSGLFLNQCNDMVQAFLERAEYLRGNQFNAAQ